MTFERRSAATTRIEIEAKSFRELQLRDAKIIPRGDQLGILVGKRDLRLKHVETRDGSRFKPILLILQLALQKIDRFFLNADERLVQQDEIKLLTNGRDDGIDRVAKRVVTAIALKIGGANLRDDAAAGKDNLRHRQAPRYSCARCRSYC